MPANEFNALRVSFESELRNVGALHRSLPARWDRSEANGCQMRFSCSTFGVLRKRCLQSDVRLVKQQGENSGRNKIKARTQGLERSGACVLGVGFGRRRSRTVETIDDGHVDDVECAKNKRRTGAVTMMMTLQGPLLSFSVMLRQGRLQLRSRCVDLLVPLDFGSESTAKGECHDPASLAATSAAITHAERTPEERAGS